MVSNIGFSQTQDIIKPIKEYLINAGMDQKDVSDLSIQSQSFSKSMGLDNVYIVQQFKGIPIKNKIGVFAVKDGKVVHFSGELVSDIAAKANTSAVKLSPQKAVIKAASALKLPNIGNVTVLEESAKNKFAVSKSNISFDNIPVELIYELIDGQLILSWDLSIHALDGENWYSVRINAVTGELSSLNNWTTKCTFDHKSTDKKEVKMTKPATPFDFKKKVDVGNFLTDGASYRVFKIPSIESPNHGSRTLVVNPANVDASPFGWHDTNGIDGPEFTDTYGNNVLASDDLDGNNGSGNFADGGAGLVFDFPYDPSDKVSNYQNASLTNLFYVSNVVHDVWYQYGFDESSGNFQQNNYGKGGLGNDQVIADGQDGSSFNNANFSTPPDGLKPRMQMFLWNPTKTIQFTVNNSSLAGEYSIINNAFDPGKVDPSSAGLTLDLALAIDAAPIGDPNDICSELSNPSALDGKFAVVRRGECNFTEKVIRCQDAGALAVLIVNNVPDNFGLGGGDALITIPTVGINQVDGEALIAELTNGAINVTLNIVANEDWVVGADGSFDNGIVIHEYGHGISSRLAGGASNGGCLTGCSEVDPADPQNCLVYTEQMGEGWSDWFALMMTIKVGDTGADSRGIGTYASGQPITGTGIRPFPYSTNTGINPVTYASTNNQSQFSAPHGVGSIWASILWDMTWAFIDRDGFDSDIYNGTGGNNLAMQLVIDGLKLQSCGPGFVDGRDGILAAADLLPNATANKCLIWNVFAARGLGFSADQGLATTRLDQTEAFDLPPANVLNCGSLGVDDFNEGVFNIYPNPSNGTFDIKVAQSIGNSLISIYDMSGRIVYQENAQLNTLHTLQVNIGAGIYMLRIEADNGSAVSTSKIVIKK